MGEVAVEWRVLAPQALAGLIDMRSIRTDWIGRLAANGPNMPGLGFVVRIWRSRVEGNACRTGSSNKCRPLTLLCHFDAYLNILPIVVKEIVGIAQSAIFSSFGVTPSVAIKDVLRIEDPSKGSA